ncbi:MAG TPA: membrane protein insertase YidC [Terriglobia bacterium]|nr:membrane protein insertase YidC [Terriglobia bacterium]
MKSDETKRLILAFALTFVIVVLWRPIMTRFGLAPEPAPEPTPAAASGSTAQPASAPGGAPAQSAAPPEAPTAQPLAPAKAAPALPTEPVQGRQARDVVVENDLYRITFSTQGAVIKSWILKKYVDEADKPLDLVNRPACETLGFPMALTLADSALAQKLNGAIFAVEPAGSAAGDGGVLSAPAKLQFTYSDGRAEVQKVFSFGHSYQVGVSVSAFDERAYLPVGVLWPGGFGDYSLGPKTLSGHSEAVYNINGELTKIKESKLKASETVAGPLSYAGLDDLYFVDIFLPHSPADVFRLSRRSWSPPNWSEKEQPAPFQAELATAAGQPLNFDLFVAPKDLELLKTMQPPLDPLIDFGWFGLVAKPLFIALRYVYQHWVHNYGWAIVILTLILNTAAFPLKLKSIHAAQRMQKVAPIIKRIQDQYKQYKLNDPRKQKMNEEVMKVYKEHGVNPLGGCLPQLVQLPILYGFYEMLVVVIELRHAPWLGCIKDLSLPDTCHPFGIPFALLPSLLIISMFVSQKITPMATADPAQQRMMQFMPLVFGLIFYRLASGLVLYYMAANVIGIGQQLIINRFIPVSTPAAANTSDAKGPGGPPDKGPAKGSGGPARRKPVDVKN